MYIETYTAFIKRTVDLSPVLPLNGWSFLFKRGKRLFVSQILLRHRKSLNRSFSKSLEIFTNFYLCFQESSAFMTRCELLYQDLCWNRNGVCLTCIFSFCLIKFLFKTDFKSDKIANHSWVNFS